MGSLHMLSYFYSGRDFHFNSYFIRHGRNLELIVRENAMMMGITKEQYDRMMKERHQQQQSKTIYYERHIKDPLFSFFRSTNSRNYIESIELNNLKRNCK